MTTTPTIAPIRVLPDEVANKIAAGEVVERPASVVKELLENALDAGATRIVVRLVAAGQRLIEVQDNGHGMSEQNALLSIERHATSKIRNAQDIDNIRSLGFRGEALASIAAVSRFMLVTRRAQDDSATQIRVEGGVLRDVQQAGAPVGTRVSVNRLYFNTPVRAKFLKGVATELGHCIDITQRHALAHPGVGFQLLHNERMLLDVPEHASLRDRAAIIWGLAFARDMIDVSAEHGGFRVFGLIGLPGLTRGQRSHQFFFVNGRPVVNRTLQFGLEDAYRGLLTVGRHPVAILLLEINPRQVDVNIHPTKREIRFREDRAAHDLIRDIVRATLGAHRAAGRDTMAVPPPPMPPRGQPGDLSDTGNPGSLKSAPDAPAGAAQGAPAAITSDREQETRFLPGLEAPMPLAPPRQSDGGEEEDLDSLAPEAYYAAVDDLGDAPLQVFDTYLLVPDGTRLLIIDQHALHERLNYDALIEELRDNDYAGQQLAVPVVFEVAPSQSSLLESHQGLFTELGIDMEPFGPNTYQITSVCHLYAESRIPDMVYSVLDALAQGQLFDQGDARADLLRIASHACKASIKAGDRLTPEERRGLLSGFRRLRPPYTCPHGRPIIVELTQRQMEKSFRRVQ